MRPRILHLAIISLSVLGGSGGVALAAGTLDLSWFTIDGGGGTSTGEALTLSGTIGQPDAAASAGDAFSLTGGFWSGGALRPLGTPESPTAPGTPGEPSSPGVPLAFGMQPARPNPFNPRTHLGVDLPEPGDVRMDVYDLCGRHVRRLIDTHLDAGRHVIVWDGRSDDGAGLASGAYFVRVVSTQGTGVQLVTLLE